MANSGQANTMEEKVHESTDAVKFENSGRSDPVCSSADVRLCSDG
jgi:hypothetical protein